MAKESSIDIKDVLSALDRNDKMFYNGLSEDQKKDFSAWMLMRWSSSVNGNIAPHYLIMTNEIVNRNFSAINKHPELQWKLLSLCGVGSKQYHQWIAPPKKGKLSPVREFIKGLYPMMKDDELDVFESCNSTDDIKELARDYGYSEDDIKKIFKK